jgi:hypothetical protein
MKAGIMANPNTAGDLGAAIKAIKKQVKVFFPNINSPGRVHNQRGTDQRQINAAGRQGGRSNFNNHYNQHNNHYNRRRHQGRHAVVDVVPVNGDAVVVGIIISDIIYRMTAC